MSRVTCWACASETLATAARRRHVKCFIECIVSTSHSNRLLVRISPMLTRISTTFLTLLLALAGNALADVRLPGIISDHMLLQRDMPVRIFGKAQPGEAVTVLFRGQTARALTDPLGRWEAWLHPLTGGPAARMTIQGTNTITIDDVLVGDVWIG